MRCPLQKAEKAFLASSMNKEKLININDCIKRYKSNYNELIIDNITIITIRECYSVFVLPTYLEIG